MRHRTTVLLFALGLRCFPPGPAHAHGPNQPPHRAPNGVLEDSFMQATGRRMWDASSIDVPVLVIAGEYDTWSYPEDREILLRDLTNAPARKQVVIKDSTHLTLSKKLRFAFFEETRRFLRE